MDESPALHTHTREQTFPEVEPGESEVLWM